MIGTASARVAAAASPQAVVTALLFALPLQDGIQWYVPGADSATTLGGAWLTLPWPVLPRWMSKVCASGRRPPGRRTVRRA